MSSAVFINILEMIPYQKKRLIRFKLAVQLVVLTYLARISPLTE